MKREDFIFTIGYSGMSAVVDAAAKRRYGKLSAEQLLEKGLFRNAFAAAVYEGDEERLQQFVDRFRQQAGIPVESVEQAKLMFGVSSVPSNIQSIVAV